MSEPWGFVVAEAAEQQARQQHVPPPEEPKVREVWVGGRYDREDEDREIGG